MTPHASKRWDDRETGNYSLWRGRAGDCLEDERGNSYSMWM